MRVAVIGTGFGEKVVAASYRRLGAETVVVSPRDPAAVADACAGPVDLVSVHSPPFLHHEHVMLALDQGRPVLCDKPFGRDAAEARAMRDRAVALDVPHFLNFEFRHHPARAELKARVDEGAIGVPQHVHHHMFSSGLRGLPHRWLFDAAAGGGWIGAYGAHVVDMLRWLLDDEVADCGGVLRTETATRPDGAGTPQPCTAEDAFTAWFSMRGGVTAVIDSAGSASADLPRRTLVLGAEGSIELLDERTLVLRRAGEPEDVVEIAATGDGYAPSLDPWLGEVLVAVRDRRAASPSFHDGLAVAEVMDRLRQRGFRPASS